MAIAASAAGGGSTMVMVLRHRVRVASSAVQCRSALLARLGKGERYRVHQIRGARIDYEYTGPDALVVEDYAPGEGRFNCLIASVTITSLGSCCDVICSVYLKWWAALYGIVLVLFVPVWLFAAGHGMRIDWPSYDTGDAGISICFFLMFPLMVGVVFYALYRKFRKELQWLIKPLSRLA